MRTGTVFRLSSDDSRPVRSSRELQELLRRRLGLISAILAAATGILAIVAAVIRAAHIRAEPSSLFTEPPLPGALFLLALAGVVMVWALASAEPSSIERLRTIEWLGVAMTALFLIVNQALALRAMAPSFLGKPMEIGIAQGAPWGILILTYGVLVPSSSRRAAFRTAGIAVAAFIPDIITLASFPAVPFALGSYLALKIFAIAVMSALAVYGAYRISELAGQAEVARALGQYVLRECLGEGGMGSVYVAEHRLLKRPCAVKFIRAEHADNDVAIKRFEREVNAVAGLTHPNTVQIYDYGQSDDGTLFFAMELLPGMTLDALVERHGPMPPARAVHVLVQLCGALREAHEAGLVHRDLKPANIMLCARGGIYDVAKLLDFGLVAALSPTPADSKITNAGIAVGTPAYMSPEQCVGDETITAATDIYSMGAVAHFLLSGSPPFRGRTPMQTLFAHTHETPKRVDELRPEVPAAVADVVARCLAKRPEDRFHEVSEVEEALRVAMNARWTTEDAKRWWREHEPAIAAARPQASLTTAVQ